jgi:predicted short-subunit dehydrogenase-like oxidoreductase (DUF2520 family)
MRITILGAGRVGQTLGRAAHEAGYEVGEIICRSRRSSVAAAKFIGAGEPQAASRARLTPADLILISTPDDSILDGVETVRANASRVGRAVVLHTSGALASDLLSPLARQGMAVGSCHPLQTFESPARALALTRGSYFCIEGDARARIAARRLVRRIGGKHFEIATGMKGLYHAAAVMASGGVVALVSISLEMIERCGLEGSQSKKVLLPLVEGTIASLRAVGAARALTGPVRRGDTGTVKRNLEALAAVDSDWLEIYLRLARRSAMLAEQAGASKQQMAELRRLLEKGLEF